MSSSSHGYDVIGDIHGHARPLERLLAKLGYERRNGVWSHADRTAIFVGDFVDRGDENLRACRIAMDMTAACAARAIMGNHEFNAIGLSTPDPERPEDFLRPHTEKNLRQAAKTRAEMERHAEEGALVLAWMRSLPLWLDLGDLRVVHAVWSPPAFETLAPYLDEVGALTKEGFVRASRKGDPTQVAREILLNGIERRMPEGSFMDSDGHVRNEVRMKWWLGNKLGLSWREAAYASPEVVAQLPHTPLPDGTLSAQDDDPRPVLFGHYWEKKPLPIFTPRHACVDASVAKGGCLAAYRFSGERELRPENFVYVPQSDP
jgi:hypothetical protein